MIVCGINRKGRNHFSHLATLLCGLHLGVGSGVWLDEPFVLLSPTLFDLPNNAQPHSNMSFKYDGITILFSIHYFAYVMSGNSRKSLRYYNYVLLLCSKTICSR